MSLHTVRDQRDELGGEPGSGLVSLLLGEAGVAAHIGDDERAYTCLSFVHDPATMPLSWREKGQFGHVQPWIL